jgi:cytochrome c-type biogenesis protein CcmH
MTNRLRRILQLMAVTLLLSAISPGYALAQGSGPTDDEVNAIAKQLYCPVCENISLDACGTAACEQWRNIIRDKLSEGWTEDEIKNYFVDQYGDRVMAEPPPRGFNWLAYIVPLLVFIIGIILLYRAFQIWRSPEPEETPKKNSKKSADKATDEYINRIEEELRKRSKE